MQNPILQILSGNKIQNQNSLLGRIQMAKSLLAGKDPNQVYRQLINSNPEFKKFVQDNNNKTIEEIAMEYNINLDILKKLI